jgi:cell pole-organizing protein PopZ
MPEPAPAVVASPPAPQPVAPSETLISEPAASAAGSALSALASTVEIERLASAPVTHTAFGNGARTLEDMVIELMRPLLKQWLDENLPATVDRLVQKEIERISRRKD